MKYTIQLNLSRLAIAWLAVIFAPMALAESSSVELLGTVTAAQANDGLGFNINGSNEAEWAAAAAAGATYARFQCTWNAVEQQTPPPNNTAAAPQYNNSQCDKAFGFAVQYGITPIVVAAYGPPYHKILGVTVPDGAAVGATSFTIEFSDGVGGDTLSSLSVPYDYFCPASTLVQIPAVVCGPRITGTGSPEGALIRSVKLTDSTHATITLASALTVALPADSSSAKYNISEILYPATATEEATDPSVIAYGNFVSFLANDMADHGLLKGQIELWNEPPWTADPWDNSCMLYDAAGAPACPAGRYSPNYGFVANLQKRTFPSGITATWNGTSGSGWASILGPRMFAATGEYATQPATVVTEESFHPYGFEPELNTWTTACLEATAVATTKAGQNFFDCVLPGELLGSNVAAAIQFDMIAKLKNPAYGIGHEITETGILPPAAGLEVQQARFIMRQFLSFQADGITPVNFFVMNSGGLPDPNFGFIQEAGSTISYTAKPNYTAISGFMADIKPIGDAPATAYSAQTLPAVVTYSGTFPLSTVHMVGARSGAAENSDAFMVWQRSFAPCNSAGVCGVWITQASPAAAPVSISIPGAMKVTQVVNLTTRDVVSYTASGDVITFMVADDPIEVLVDPSASAAKSGVLQPTQTVLNSSIGSSTYGNQVVLTASIAPYKSNGNSTDGESVLFMSGKTLLGTGTLASGVATFATTSLPAGVNTILAEYTGDLHYGTSTGFTYVTVTRANPTLTLPTITAQICGSAQFLVAGSSNSPGAINVTVLSGPALITTRATDGVMIESTGIGAVVLGATQLPTANYTAAPLVTTSFVVTAEAPALVFVAVPTKTYGNAPFPIGAKSTSHGAVTYSVVSGPATVAGSTITLTGAGTVVIQASQAAQGTYQAATTTLSFDVVPAVPSLSISPIHSQTFGVPPITVSATSVSSGQVTYSVVSGPARVVNSKIVITGAGTVIVGATQAPSGNYAASAMATTSFTVNAATPTIAFYFYGSADKTYGDAPFPATAKSASHGAIAYTVVKGPARVSGIMVTITGTGDVVIQADQAAEGNYLAATAKWSFVVAPATPTLSLAPIPSQTYGAAPVPVSGTSESPGTIHYSIVSGPATLAAGNTIAITGAGTVVVGATQLPSANYAAPAMATTSFVVNAEAPTLIFNSVNAKTNGDAPFLVMAKSVSHGAVAYTVASGPATVSGDMVTLTGAGTVVLQASQAAQGNYLAATTTISVAVAQ